MPRLSAGPETQEIAKSFVSPVTFVNIGFSSGPQRLHDSVGTLTWGGFDWLGVGSYGGVETIEEGDDLSAYGVRLFLSSLGTGIAAETISGAFSLLPVVIYFGFLKDDGSLLADPKIIWAGRTDSASIVAGADGGVSMTCESHLARLDRASGKMYAVADLKAKFPDDTGFDFMRASQDIVLVWGEMRGGSSGTSLSGRVQQSGFIPRFP